MVLMLPLLVLREWVDVRASGWLLSLVLALAFQATVSAQGVTLIPVRKSPPEMSSFDESTTWALHVKSETTIHSPLLRLRDVATPSNPSSPWWDRAGAAIIGLMPVDEQDMVVERSRLVDAVARSTSMPQIQWSGAETVRVTFRRKLPAASGPIPTVQLTASQSSSSKKVPSVAPITPSERERITKLIQYAVDRYDGSLRNDFDITIDPQQPTIETFRDLRRVDSIAWELQPSEGTAIGQVVGMNSRQPVTAAIEIKFTARPLIVVAREGLRRGAIVSEADLILLPAGRSVSTTDVLTEISDAVGMQVQTVLQKGSPVMRSAIAPMTVVERGDLVEVHVVGGGITIATGAKSLAAGAQGDLIPVETLEPRRKLMARVAGIGIVEIITRPPRVQ